MSTEDRDIFFMKHALSLAQEAIALGEIPVAAIIVKDGEIISRSHNRRELDKDPTAHAELIAIREASAVLGDWRLEGCTLYVTLEPCAMCAGAMWLARIDRCVFACHDPKSGFLGSVSNINDFPVLNHHYEVRAGVCEQEGSDLLQGFFRAIRAEKKRLKQQRATENQSIEETEEPPAQPK